MKQKLVGILALLATSGIGYVIFSHTDNAKDKVAAAISRDICSSIKIGMPMNQVAEIAANKKASFRQYAPDGVRVGAKGWYLNCRCNVLFKNAAVTSISPSVCID